jgi:hypothetical protein
MNRLYSSILRCISSRRSSLLPAWGLRVQFFAHARGLLLHACFWASTAGRPDDTRVRLPRLLVFRKGDRVNVPILTSWASADTPAIPWHKDLRPGAGFHHTLSCGRQPAWILFQVMCGSQAPPPNGQTRRRSRTRTGRSCNSTRIEPRTMYRSPSSAPRSCSTSLCLNVAVDRGGAMGTRSESP